MGFFDKLMGKKKQDNWDQIFKAIEENKKLISKSPNYQTVFYGLKELYFKGIWDFSIVVESEENARAFVKQALDLTKKDKNIEIPQQFYDMPIHVYRGKGIVLEIPNPARECECNYVALLCRENKCMYTNEYYSLSKTFGLCLVSENSRMSLKTETDTFEKFVKATVGC